MYDLQTMVRVPVYDDRGQVVGDHVEPVQVEVTDR
jgi:hypothetical protein